MLENEEIGGSGKSLEKAASQVFNSRGRGGPGRPLARVLNHVRKIEYGNAGPSGFVSD
jgi:hypothetical protein